MNSTSPRQGETYLGLITDTRRWRKFKHREDDIFVCTPPKCGTIWTQAICAMLIFGQVDHGAQSSLLSPWIDAVFAPIEEYLGQVEAQTHRRYIKTHTPLDGIPFHPECTYLVVFRDPRDVYFSGINHRDNMANGELANQTFPSGPDAFNDWLTRVREPKSWDLQSLDSLVHFFNSYWPYRNLPNVHLYHYSDMKRDLMGTIRSMADALGVHYDETEIASFATAASFSNMKRNAEQFVPESGTGLWKNETHFFASGSNHQWKDKLSKEELESFDARINELLMPDQVDWMLNGNG